MKVMRDGRPVTVEVTADGAGLVSHAGSALLAQVADKLGLTKALSLRLGAIKQRRRGHDPGRVIRDLAVMLADGGECVSDLGAVRDQQALFGPVASDSTAFRVIRADRAGPRSDPPDLRRCLGPGARSGRQRARERRSRRDHRQRRAVLVAAGLAAARAARAPAPRGAALVHRPRRLPLPSDPHRPARARHRDRRVPPPPARPRRGPHPRRQGHPAWPSSRSRRSRSTRRGSRSCCSPTI